MHDTTSSLAELKAKARTAEEQHAQLDAIFYGIGDCVIVTDDSGKVSRINQAALDLLGYTEQEALGAWYPRLVVAEDEHGNTLDPLDRPITQAFLLGKPISKNIFYHTKISQKLPVAVTVSPILLANNPVGAISIIRDISHEHQVDRMKSEFISIASHQLRTPLSAVKMYAHMLAEGFEGKLTEKQQKLAEVIISASDRMNVLIDTLLNVSRIEAGKITLKLRKINVKDIVGDVVEEFQPTAQINHILLYMNEPDKIFIGYGDKLLINEIVASLISNAIKYTPENGKIAVAIEGTPKKFKIIVADNGYGIPKNAQKLIFTKFFRAGGADNQLISGTGLGLYTVKLLTEAIGGRASFKSKEGEGSSFFVTIPLYKSKEGNEGL
jgi:PAS domain S-box-containing protein